MTTHTPATQAPQPPPPSASPAPAAVSVTAAATPPCTGRRRHRGITAEEAAEMAARLAQGATSARKTKQAALSAHWVPDASSVQHTPKRRTRPRGMTKAEANQVAEHLNTASAAAYKQQALATHWQPGPDDSSHANSPRRDTPQHTARSHHRTPRLTTRKEAETLASRVPQPSVKAVRERMLRGTWHKAATTAPEKPAATSDTAHIGHRRPRGMQGVDTRNLAASVHTPDIREARQKILGSHWTLSQAGDASTQPVARPTAAPAAAVAPPAVPHHQRNKKDTTAGAGAGTGAGAGGVALKVPTVAQLRARNSSSHWSFSGSPSPTPHPKSSGSQAPRTCRKPPVTVNHAVQSPPASLSAGARRRSHTAQEFRERNRKSHWSISDGAGASQPNKTRDVSRSTPRRVTSRPVAPPTPPVSARQRMRNALSSSITFG